MAIVIEDPGPVPPDPPAEPPAPAPDTTSPTVSSVTTSNPDGTYRQGDVIYVLVNFSERVDVVIAEPELTLETGATDRVAIYTAGSGTSTLIFAYTVESGDSSADLNYVGTNSLAFFGGWIKDLSLAGNNAVLTLGDPLGPMSLGQTSNIVIDAVTPVVNAVTSSTPDSTYNAGDVVSIQLVFSEAVTLAGTLDLTLETGGADRTISYASGSGSNMLTFDYTVQTGDTSTDLDYVSTAALALSSGTLRDVAGNDASLALPTPGSAGSLGANKALVILSDINNAPTGLVTISGTPSQGEVLAAANTVADADGLGIISYQWRANGQNVGIGPTLQLTQAQVGKTITVVASYMDGLGTSEYVISAATAAVANINDAPTGSVTISGTPIENQVLTANTAALVDVDGLGTLHYQWQRDTGAGFTDVGTDQATYTLGDADIGGMIRVLTSYLDQQGTPESVTSSSTQAVLAFNDPHTGGASITGTAIEDQTLTALSTLADVDGLGVLHYQWQHDVGSGFVDVGSDQATYTLGDVDVGGNARVVISYIDGQGFFESATSASTAIGGVNDPHTGGAAIGGTAAEDEVLTAVSTLDDIDGLGTLHHQWQRDTGSGFTSVGSDQSTYTLGDGDIGGVVRVTISYTDLQGNLEAATSGATAAVAAVNDTPTGGGVAIIGTATEDQVLTADVGTLADPDGLGALHYQWERNSGSGFGNVGADQATYTLGDTDVGALFRLKVSYTDGQGFANAVSSTETGPVANVNDAPTGSVTVSGTPAQGRTLTAANTLADLDGLGTITYQWQADGADIVMAIGTTLVLTAAEVGKAITAVAKYTDAHGTEEAVPSTPTAFVAADGDAPLAISFSPQDEDGSVLLTSNITLTFNETVVAGVGNIVLKTSSGAIVETFNVASSSQLAFGGTTLTIDPTSNLGSGVGYRVEFAPSAVLDLAGNAFAGAPGYNFATPSRPINGTGGNNSLFGTEGDDVIDGGAGADRMIGGLGDDTYRVDNAGDVVVEQPGGGVDHVIVNYPYMPFSTYTLGANVENLTLGNWSITFLAYALNGTGNELNNVLTGNNAANNLTGLGGADTLFGGLGGDRFVYRSASDSGPTRGAWDVIGDFNRAQGDKIDLQAIDANVSLFGNQAFVYIGSNTFAANAAGRVRFDAGTHMLYGNTDADADAEFAIELAGVTALLAADIVL